MERGDEAHDEEDDGETCRRAKDDDDDFSMLFFHPGGISSVDRNSTLTSDKTPPAHDTIPRGPRFFASLYEPSKGEPSHSGYEVLCLVVKEDSGSGSDERGDDACESV